jgi:hypothetical protein
MQEAQGINEALKENGAEEGDLIMIGDWDFNYYERRNRWITDLGLENISPRRRFQDDGEQQVLQRDDSDQQ